MDEKKKKKKTGNTQKVHFGSLPVMTLTLLDQTNKWTLDGVQMNEYQMDRDWLDAP